MSRHVRRFVLLGLLPLLPLGAAAQTGGSQKGATVTQPPTRTLESGGRAAGQTRSAPAPGAVSRQQRTQRDQQLAIDDFTVIGPGSSVPVPGLVTANPGNVFAGQVVRLVPGNSVTIREVSGLVHTYALPEGYVLPIDVGQGSYVVATAMEGGFVTLANAGDVLPANLATGGLGTNSPNITMVASANDNVSRPNITTQPIPGNQGITTGIGGFYVPSNAGPGVLPVGPESGIGGTFAAAGGTLEVTPTGAFANGTFANPGTRSVVGTDVGGRPVTFSGGGPTGIPASQPVTSISYSDRSLDSMAAGMAGTPPRTLPATALRGGSLAVIEGVGRNIVMRTVQTTWRVLSWDGETLEVRDDEGRRRKLDVADETFIPRNLLPGKLVVLDFRRDGTLRSVRYPL